MNIVDPHPEMEKELTANNESINVKMKWEKLKKKWAQKSGKQSLDKLDGKYFGAKIADNGFMNYFNNKHQIDYYIFINQFEVQTNYEHCLERTRGDYERNFIVHYSIYTKYGDLIAGNRIKTFYNSNANRIQKILYDNMEKLSNRILEDLP